MQVLYIGNGTSYRSWHRFENNRLCPFGHRDELKYALVEGQRKEHMACRTFSGEEFVQRHYLSCMFYHLFSIRNLLYTNKWTVHHAYCISVRNQHYLFCHMDELKRRMNTYEWIRWCTMKLYHAPKKRYLNGRLLPSTQVVPSSSSSKSSSQEQTWLFPFLLQIWEHTLRSFRSHGCTESNKELELENEVM